MTAPRTKPSSSLWAVSAKRISGPKGLIPDPKRPGKSRRTKLFCFLDDHSRKLLHGRFSFAEGLLELVFRLRLEKYGVPKRVYYDHVPGHMIVVLFPITLCGGRRALPRAHAPPCPDRVT